MPVSNLGRIGFVTKGGWSAGPYKYLDVVKHAAGTWICAVPTTTAEPGSNADWQNALTTPSVTGIANWDELSGAQTPPLIVYDDGDYWGLTQTVTDIAMSKPSEGNDNWRKLGPKTPISNPGIIGVKMQAQGGSGGRWLSIDDSGNEVATPSTSWFNAHPVFGGIVGQIIDGQSMVKVPKFYYKRGTAADGKAAWWISDQQIAGFTVFPAFVLDGVEVDQFWYGKYQASESGGKLQSIAGVLPKVSISLTQSLAMAEARNVGGVEGFRLHHYDMWLAVQWLYLVENATMDSQTKSGQGRVSASSAANVDASDVAQATYRGIVGLWGNVYQWLDGARTKNSVMERRSYTGGWISTGQAVPNSGAAHYPLTFRSTAPDEFIADTFLASNSDATLPDYVLWRNSGEYYPYVGGHWAQAANAGLWYVHCAIAASSSSTTIGARLARV